MSLESDVWMVEVLCRERERGGEVGRWGWVVLLVETVGLHWNGRRITACNEIDKEMKSFSPRTLFVSYAVFCSMFCVLLFWRGVRV